jgi:hypothetical protein
MNGRRRTTPPGGPLCRGEQINPREPDPRDPDVDMRIPSQRRELAGHRLDLLGAVAADGRPTSPANSALTGSAPARAARAAG